MAVTYARTGLACAVTASGTSKASARRSRSIATRPDSSRLLQELRNAAERVRAHHHVHVGRAVDDGRPLELRDAATDTDAKLRPPFLHVPEPRQRLPELLRGFLTHRAGVEEDEVGIVRAGRGMRTLALPGAPPPSRSR